jgi:uncharacterized RDD family membrane protein YckC
MAESRLFTEKSPNVTFPTERPIVPRGSYTFAGFWWRFLAYVIDATILTIAGTLTGAVLGFFLGASGVNLEAIRVIGFLFGVCLWWLYYALFESSKYMATPGKLACGLVVTTSIGSRLGFGRATGRYFGKILSGLFLGVGYLMIAWTAKKQGLHDMMSDCLVMKKLPTAESNIDVPK